jgi:hypothetical protein
MTGEIYIEHALDLVQASPVLSAAVLSAQDVVERPFGDAFADLDSDATGKW